MLLSKDCAVQQPSKQNADASQGISIFVHWSFLVTGGRDPWRVGIPLVLVFMKYGHAVHGCILRKTLRRWDDAYCCDYVIRITYSKLLTVVYQKPLEELNVL
jgi:hypothetical protein